MYEKTVDTAQAQQIETEKRTTQVYGTGIINIDRGMDKPGSNIADRDRGSNKPGIGTNISITGRRIDNSGTRTINANRANNSDIKTDIQTDQKAAAIDKTHAALYSL